MDTHNVQLLSAYGAVKPCDGTIISLCAAVYLIDGVRVTVVSVS